MEAVRHLNNLSVTTISRQQILLRLKLTNEYEDWQHVHIRLKFSQDTSNNGRNSWFLCSRLDVLR